MKSLIFLGLLLPVWGWTADMTWNEILILAEKENTSLKTARQELEAAQMNEGVAMKGYLPTLRGNVSATRTGSRSGAGAIVSNGVLINSSASSSITDNYVAALNLNQNIFNGLRDQERLHQAEWRSKNKYWTLVRAKSDLSYNLKEAFANLQYAQEYVELTDDIIGRRESNYKLVSLRYENGRENKGSVLLSEAYLEQARFDNIQARDSLIVARRKLFSLVNRDGFDEYQVKGEVPLPAIGYSEDVIVNLATETPDYNQAFTLEQVADKEIDIARGSFFPSLDLTGNVTRQDQSFFPNNQRERWSVALTLTVPIFDGMGDYSTLKAATFTKYAADATKRTTYLNLIPQIKLAQNTARQSDIKLKVDTKFRDATSTRAEISRAKYNNGLLTFEDWDIIESDLIQKQITYLQSKRDRVIKYAAFEKAIGKGALP